MKILFVNNKKEQCGVYQYGKRVCQILKRGTQNIYKYLECDTEHDYNSFFENSPSTEYQIVIYNYHPATLNWINQYTMKGKQKNIGIIHDDQNINGFDLTIDTGNIQKNGNMEGLPRPLYNPSKWNPDDYLPLEVNLQNAGVLTPVFVPDFPYGKSGGDIPLKNAVCPTHGSDRILEVNQDIEDFISAYQTTGIPIFGSFGFGFDNKGFHNLIKIVNEQYDEAVIKMVIPVAYYSQGESLVRHVRYLCETQNKKPNIHLMITHIFFSNTDILRFLASNTMNIFLYDYMKGRGLSSVIDFALSVNVPIGISNSYMFRHIFDDSICLYNNPETPFNPKDESQLVKPTTIKECIANSTHYCKQFRELNSNENLIKKMDNIINYMRTISQANQDTFVLGMTKEKRNGTYLEIGTNSGITNNNTYLLEREFGWSGLLVEYDASFVEEYKKYRPNSKYIINDARKIDYLNFLESNNMPHNIDYLQIDLDVDNRSTLDVLELLDNTILDTYKFATITFEHDIYRGNYYDTREISRAIFARRGYILIFPDVKVFFGGKYCEFEDWYVHPDLIPSEIINNLYRRIFETAPQLGAHFKLSAGLPFENSNGMPFEFFKGLKQNNSLNHEDIALLFNHSISA
jgi:hypothetical protein